MTQLLEQLGHVFDILYDAAIVIDREHNIVLCNKATEALFSYKQSELIGRPLNILIPKRFHKVHTAQVRRFMQRGQANLMGNRPLLQVLTKSGAEIPVSISIGTFEVGDDIYAIAIVRDASVISSQFDEVFAKIERDVLTDLGNRLALSKKINWEMNHNSQGFAVLFLDLTKFKPFNDKYGHKQGDQVLQLVAQRIKAMIREHDFAARMGGDEFVVVLVGVHDETIVSERARQIAESIAMPFAIGESEELIGVNIGCALYPKHGLSEVELLEHADQAMYAAKKQKLPVALYTPG